MLSIRSLVPAALLALSAPAQAGVLYDALELERDYFVQGGGVLVDSVGLSVRAGASPVGTITVDDLPDRSAITEAFLYWMTIGGAGDDTVTFDGQTIVGEQIGEGEDTCWSIGANRGYKADVSHIVTLPGSYEITDVGDMVWNGNNMDAQGATLLVFYDDPSSDNAGFIKVYEGLRDNMPGPGAVEPTYTVFDGLNIPVQPVRAEMTWSVGDSQTFADGQTTFEGNVLAVDNFDDSEEGPLWDTDEWDVLPYMYVGMTQATAGLSVGGTANDCLAIGFAILEYDLPCDHDGDGDGSGICVDCDDNDPTIDGTDADGDGRSPCSGDCDDTDAQVYLGHVELCDGKDNNCDGTVPADENVDIDGDGYLACEDCADENSEVHPDAFEICANVRDDDCDGFVDEADCSDENADDDDDTSTGDDDDATGGDDDDDGGGGGGGRRSSGCGCGVAEGSAPIGLLGLLLLGLRRRR
jgi:MYXO-CTERM domain-containing protein